VVEKPAEVLLMAAKIPVSAGRQEELAIVFFDCGSQRSYITNHFARRLNARKLAKNDLTLFTFGSDIPTRLSSPRYSIELRDNDDIRTTVPVSGIDKISEGVTASIGNYRPDLPVPMTPRVHKPDILIGMADFWKFFRGMQHVEGDIYQIWTTFGPLFCGRREAHVFRAPATAAMSVVERPSDGEPGEEPAETDDTKGFWDLETLGIKDNPTEDDDATAMQMFKESLQLIDGRYQVAWPWKEEVPDLPTNFGLAYHRLRSNYRSLQCRPELLKAYDDYFSDWHARDIIELTERRGYGLEHYLAHHPVITHKLRVVVDGSTHLAGAKSLNDCLHRGPVLLPDLAGLLLRFRLPPVVMMADVEKAFLMLSLGERDREVCKFLWIKDVTRPPTADNLLVYRFKRVPFGVVSSPFLLAATIQEHLKNFDSPLALQMQGDTYVDNILISSDTSQEAIAHYHEAKSIFQQASMNLREFVSNSPEVQAAIPAEDRLDQPRPKVLGIRWDTAADSLEIDCPCMERGPSRGRC